jgi:hypothetical protein
MMNGNILEISTLIQGFKFSCQTEGKSPRTIDWYISFMERFRWFLAKRHLPTNVYRINKDHIRSFISYLQTEAKVPHSSRLLSAATDKDDRLPRWSNRGDWVSLAAPGVDIYSTLPGDDYGYQSGTSQAAALVSGEAALLFTIATDTNGDGNVNDEIRHAIETSCDEVEQDGLAKGRINILRAVSHK